MDPVCAFRQGDHWCWSDQPLTRLSLPVTELTSLPDLLPLHTASHACGLLPYPALPGSFAPDQRVDILLFDRFEQGPVLPAPTGQFRLTSAFMPDMGRAEYDAAFARIQHWLRAGDCYQVNFAQRFSATAEGSAYAGWWRLMQQHTAPRACFFAGTASTFLSASPELFLQIDGRAINTAPIKGSRPRGRTSAEDMRLADELLHSAKDRAENLMIVDLLRNDLGAICTTGSVTAAPLFELQRFSNVQHLVSHVSGILRADIRPLDALLACSPGGSITGAPKRRAMEIIHALEPVPRHAYCGSFFTLDANGHLTANLLIRTFQLEGQSISIHGGGGITVASDRDSEYEECHFKVNRLMQALADAPIASA